MPQKSTAYFSLITATAALFFFAPSVCSSTDLSVDYQGKFGIGAELGYTRLPLRNRHAPDHVPGISGGFRIFWAITNAIGLEASIIGSNLRDYEPLMSIPSEDETLAPQVVAYPKVYRPQQQQLSVGVIYNLDIYRLTPSISAGFARMRTGAFSVERGATVMDNHLYLNLGADYRITSYVWAGFHTRFNLALSENAPYSGPIGFMIRITAVWTIERLSSSFKKR